MEKKIVVTKRFRNNTYKVYQYLLKEYSAKTAFQFLNKLEQRIELIIAHPSIGKPSKKCRMYEVLFLLRIIKSFTACEATPLKFFAFLI